MITTFTWKEVAKDGLPPEYVPCLVAAGETVVCGILSVEGGHWRNFFDRKQSGVRQDTTHWFPVSDLRVEEDK